jgi:hypothetical protein
MQAMAPMRSQLPNASCSGRAAGQPSPRPTHLRGQHVHGAARPQQHRPTQLCRSSPLDDPEPQNLENLRKKYFKEEQAASQNPGGSPGGEDPDQASALDIVNPYELGRQARQAFNDAWSQLSRVASPTRSFVIDDTVEVGVDADFAAPQAAYTTVLVVGATGRVGRILTRKLLLRGYKVKALVRNKSGLASDVLPAAVELVEGDVGDNGACQKAVKGVNKVRHGASMLAAMHAAHGCCSADVAQIVVQND